MLDGTEIEDNDILVQFQNEVLIVGDSWETNQKDNESHTGTASIITAPNSPSHSPSPSQFHHRQAVIAARQA